ncbi:MAG: VOC family protein [Pseudomonadota bacterium]
MVFKPSHCVAWIEIPVTDLAASIRFYAEVTGQELVQSKMGEYDVGIFQPLDPEAGIAGNLYVGKPAPAGTGATIHLMC